MLLLKSINWINRDRKIRLVFLKYEIKKIILKSLLYNETFIFYKKFFFDFKFKKFTFKSSISRYRTSCMFLGNSRAIIQPFKLSRHACKKYAALGFIVGLKKSSF